MWGVGHFCMLVYLNGASKLKGLGHNSLETFQCFFKQH